MPDEKEGVTLKATVAGLMGALREAKYLGDLESAKLSEVYKKEKDLSSFTVPAFTISDVEIELHFSIAEPPEQQKKKGEALDIKVNISPKSLKGLEAHQVSVMKLKISPVSLRAFEEME